MRMRSTLIALSLLSLATIGTALYASEGDHYTLLDDSNLRQGPDSSYASVGVAQEGEQAVELESKGAWVKVRLPASGDEGWLYADSLQAAVIAAGNRSRQQVETAPQQQVVAPDVKVAATSQRGVPSSSAAQKAVSSQTATAPIFEDGATAGSPEPIVSVDQAQYREQKQHAAIKTAKSELAAAGVDQSQGMKPTATTASRTVGAGQSVVEADALTQPVADAAGSSAPSEKQVAPKRQTTGSIAIRSVDEQADAKSEVSRTNRAQEKQPASGETRAAVSHSEPAHSEPIISVHRSQSVVEADVLGRSEAPANAASKTLNAPSIEKTAAASGDHSDQGDEKMAATAKKAVRTGQLIVAEDALVSPVVPAPQSVGMAESRPSAAVEEAWKAPAAMESENIAQPATAEQPSQVAVAPLPVQESVSSTEVMTVVKTATIRTGPGISYDVLGWVSSGSSVEATDSKGDWRKVRMQDGGRSGWIAASSLGKADAVAVQSTAQEAAASYNVEPVVPTQQKQVEQPRPKVMPVQAAAADVVADTETSGSNLYVFTRKSNLRAGPDVKFDVVSWAGNGSYATEIDRKGEWVRVQMQVSKRIGWVYGKLLKLEQAGVALPVANIRSGQIREEPVVRVASAGKKAPAKDLYLFKQTGNLRAGPGKQYEVVAWGGKHESAKVIKRQDDWRRVRMSISGKVGWVFHKLLEPATEDREVVAASEAAKWPAMPAILADHSPRALYQAKRTEPLRADALQFAELTGWVSRGELVSVLDQRPGWMLVRPKDTAKSDGWIRSSLLKRHKGGKAVAAEKFLSGADKVVDYQDRISKGETFNFSYLALEQALYRVPVEDLEVRIARDDLKALFRKDTYDKSRFDIKLKSGRRNMTGTIRVLGSSTRIFKKKSLRIKLDKESSRWYGRRQIALRSMASDKALMREWMAWKLYAAMGMKVPEVHFVRVNFNRGEKTALYLSVEWMGRRFLEAHDLEPGGGFYQPNDASHCGDLNSYEHMETCFDKIAPNDGDFSSLSAMARAISSATDANIDTVLPQYFDEESVLNWITVNALVTNGDTYNKNYWLHYSPNRQRWTLIPWDYNLTFGRVYDPYGVKPFKIFNDNFQYYFPIDVGAGNPLKDRSVHNPRLRARIETKLKHLMGIEPNGSEDTFGWFSPTVMQARIGNLAAVVGKEVYKDTFLEFGEEEFTKTYESLMHFVTGHDHYLKAKMQGPFIWQPSPPFDPAAPAVLQPLPLELYGHGFVAANGQSLHMTDDGWGYFVARLNFEEPVSKRAEFKVHVEGGAVPRYLPNAQLPRRCIRRSWVVSTETRGFAADANLMVEYLQENSKRTEVPDTLHEELLELWMLDGHHWKPLKTEVNEYANTLLARGVHLESGHVQRFVACSPF